MASFDFPASPNDNDTYSLNGVTYKYVAAKQRWEIVPTLHNFETTAQLDIRDTANRDRANHTGTQTASTISDFDTEVSNNTDVVANTSARHDAVTVVDSSEIDFTLTGQEITGEIKNDSLTASKLHPDVRSVLGLSAYAIAVANGFVGTEQEWLDSLNGKSAYELAVEAGFPGTLADFNYQFSSTAYPNAFVTSWNTENLSTGSSGSKQIKLPLVSDGTYDFLVDWGDGTTNTITAWDDPNTTHTYAEAGNKGISIAGTCHGWKFNNTGDRLKLLYVHDWGSGFRLGDGGGYFFGCANVMFLTNNALDLEGCTNFSNAFHGCSSMVTVPGMDAWNTGFITYMGLMFYGCTNFNQPLNNWNVSNVKDMSYMFNGCTNFNQPLNNWNVSNVESMVHLFYGCTNFNRPLDSWNVSKVTAMFNMFQNCINFNQPLNNWNVSKVTAMYNMFFGCINFDQPLDNWNVSSVTSMGGFLAGANAWSDQYYDDVLLAWSQLSLKPNVPANFGDAKYTESAARQSIIDNYSWSITDGGAA